MVFSSRMTITYTNFTAILFAVGKIHARMFCAVVIEFGESKQTGYVLW